MFSNAVDVVQYCGCVFVHGGGHVALLAESFECSVLFHKCLPLENPVDRVGAIVLGQQLTLEGWQGGLQLVYWDFVHIYKESGPRV